MRPTRHHSRWVVAKINRETLTAYLHLKCWVSNAMLPITNPELYRLLRHARKAARLGKWVLDA